MAEAKWAADERKLSSASDDISYGRFKSAQNTVDRHLKKHPKSQPALVLRMVLSEKTGGSDKEVVNAFEAVRATGELTGRSAWWVGNTLRSIQRLDLCLEMWASSWEANPDRVDMGEQTFLYAVSAWNTDTMMSSSRKMFNKLKTPIWARVAAWAEYASKAPQPSPETPHAEQAPPKALMIAKLLINTSGKDSSTSDIYWLRLQILISSGDLNEALKIAQEQGKGGSLAMMWYRMEAVPVILSRFEADQEEGWKVEWDWVTSKIKEDTQAQRNFAYYRYLIKTTVALGETLFDKTLDYLREVDALIGAKERSPLLAILELDSKRGDGGGAVSDQWVKDVETYWSRWGSKQSVVTELEAAIATSEAKSSKVLNLLEEKRKSSHSDLQAFNEIVNAETFCLRHQSTEWIPENRDVKRLWDLYLSGLTYGKSLPITDLQPADDVGLSAVHLLILQFSKDKSVETPLLSALACLQYILSQSPSSAHAKFLLIRVARLAGAPSLISETIFGSGGYAEVQLDTLLHPVVERASGEAYVKAISADWSGQLAKAEQMYRRTASDIPEYIKQALQNESYAKVPGMKSFQTQIATSLPGAITRIERTRYNMLEGRIPGPREVKAITKDVAAARKGELSDTRDWDLMPTIGGNLPDLKDLTRLGLTIEGKWVEDWGSVVLAVTALSEGRSMALDEVAPEGLLSAEDSALTGLVTILRRCESVSKPAQEETASSLDGIFGDLIASASRSDVESRWFQTYPSFLLVEVSKILEIISKRLETLSQPTGTGKTKKKADPRVVSLATAVKEIRNDLKTMSLEVAEKLGELVEADKGIEWDEVAKDLIEDKEFVGGVGKKIVEARSGVVKNLQTVLSGKKL